MQGSKPMNWEPDFMSLSSEDLRRYDNRSGFDLVSCQEVGLPVYKLTVNALTQIRKPIPPIEEFILKAIDAGLSSEDEIAGFLGLEFSTVREAIVSLRSSEDIDLIAPDATQLQIWKLTKKGERTLQEAYKKPRKFFQRNELLKLILMGFCESHVGTVDLREVYLHRRICEIKVLKRLSRYLSFLQAYLI